MDKQKVQNLIKELIERTTIAIKEISAAEEESGNIWVSVEANEPRYFTEREGEGLHALNHLAHRILEGRASERSEQRSPQNILVDINGFQKKHIENVRAIAHMMSERARYFKSNIEVDPMPAFERRIIHEFLASANDVMTESVGTGRSRRVVIKYVGDLKN